MYILSIIKNIYSILTPSQKSRFILLQIFYIFSAFIQTAGIASIAPFIGLISKPEAIHTNDGFKYLYNVLSFKTDIDFIVAFACATIFMIILSNIASLVTLWITTKYSIKTGGNLQSKLFHIFLSKEYIFHKINNYNQCISVISQDMPRFVYMVLQPYLLMCSSSIMAVVILTGLLIINPVIALVVFLVVGGAYTGTYYFIKTHLKRHGEIVTEKHRIIQSVMSESFIGIKEIKLNNLETKYSDLYKNANLSGLNSSSFIALAGDVPRFVIETISFCTLLLFSIVILKSSSNDGNVVYVISIYALAGYKLLPNMQQLFKSITNISANGELVFSLRNLLDNEKNLSKHRNVNPLLTVDTVRLKNVSYIYPDSCSKVIDNIDLVFEKGKLNTIIGPSGSGKSTLVDITLGLLSPKTGEIFADDILLAGDYMKSYQRSIGYVPQNVFVLDDTVAANVAFGVSKYDIDVNKVIASLDQVNALDFVNNLPEKINTRLGQDGKLLSGGQRQRIGIARALYRENKILLFDEPTSSLDIESEYSLMSLLEQIKSKALIVVISHRPAAIKLADNIFVIKNGELLAHGNYEFLVRNCIDFQRMMELCAAPAAD